MQEAILGRLSKIDLREIWRSESADFTPWLARADNLAVLGETLGIDLELEAVERAVGPFRADILCRAGAEHLVLIENQLERTDHIHLGQLLTYASGLDTATIVWIAARFTDEHRSTLDWLNRITDESFRFFGLEVELWRIGDSAAAPKFNIVSQPNDWAKLVHRSAGAIDAAAVSDVRLMQREYWAALNEEFNRQAGPIAGTRKPRPESFMQYALGRSGFNLYAAMSRQAGIIRVQLEIPTKVAFNFLLAQREEIEKELSFTVEWDIAADKVFSQINLRLHDVDVDDTADWPRQHAWLASRLNDLHRVFSGRVKLLNEADLSVDSTVVGTEPAHGPIE